MALCQFLIRNRHSNQWYGRVIIPHTLRDRFNGKREFRRTLKTTDKTTAKRRALAFWVECQNGFEQLHVNSREITFENGHQFLIWNSGRYVKRKDRKKAGFITERHRIEFVDTTGIELRLC